MRLEITRRADLAVARPARARAPWRAVAVPDEHGGWGLTAEPALLGVLVAPSWAGLALAFAALVAFLVRTPLKVVLVDRWRHRWLARTRLAARIATLELAVLVGLTFTAVALAGWEWLAPIAVAAPLVAVELWFDMRSRSRRLVPELSGAVGIASVAAAIALAGGTSARLAVALWLVLAGRAVAAVPFVRTQISRLRHGSVSMTTSDVAQAVGMVLAVAAFATDRAVMAGSVAVVALAVAQLVWLRRPPVPAKRLGVRQLILGVTVVGVTAAGVWA
jgi:hypothetical protein